MKWVDKTTGGPKLNVAEGTVAKPCVHRIVVIREGCEHCRLMLIAINATGREHPTMHVHVVKRGDNTDPLGWVNGENCPFPHCFEYVHNPEWASVYVEYVLANMQTHHTGD